MSEIDTLKALGLTSDDIMERVVERVTDRLLESRYFDEDGDEGSAPSQFATAMQSHIKAKIDEAVANIAGRHVLPNVATYVENLTLQETNRWGEKTGTALTFVEYLVQRAEAYLQEKVDYDGNVQSESRGSYWKGTQTRIAHLVHKHLHYSIETAMKRAIENANAVIVKGLQATVEIKLREIADGLSVHVKTKG